MKKEEEELSGCHNSYGSVPKAPPRPAGVERKTSPKRSLFKKMRTTEIPSVALRIGRELQEAVKNEVKEFKPLFPMGPLFEEAPKDEYLEDGKKFVEVKSEDTLKEEVICAEDKGPWSEKLGIEDKSEDKGSTEDMEEYMPVKKRPTRRTVSYNLKELVNGVMNSETKQ